jgi:hypothetical protein
MRVSAKHLDDAAEQLELFLKDAFVEDFNGPGPDPISRQVTRIIGAQLEGEHTVVESLVRILRQHAADVRKQLAASDEGDSELGLIFRGDPL